MKTLLILTGLLVSFVAVSMEQPMKKIAPYYVQYLADESVAPTEGKVQVQVHFYPEPESPLHPIRYGINGSDETAGLTEENAQFELPHQQARKAVFQFYYDGNYDEISTDSIEIKKGLCTRIILNFLYTPHRYEVEKPVIYLYPETTQQVSVGLKTTGKLTFTYPQTENTWNVTATPDGQLHTANWSGPYLFWESETDTRIAPSVSQSGFVVAGKDVVAFLETQLTAMGFNDREKTDFITYWGPQLARNAWNTLFFECNEACDRFAQLAITPEPAHINRVYLLWAPVTASELPVLQPQQLPVLDRSGFDVLEWGGVMITPEAFTVAN